MTKTENVLDGNDSRVGGVSYANGKLWAMLGSAATDSTGIRPTASRGSS